MKVSTRAYQQYLLHSSYKLLTGAFGQHGACNLRGWRAPQFRADPGCGINQTIQINPAGGLSKEEIDRLVTEADQFAQADAQKREMRRLKNRIEGLIYTNEKVLSQFSESLPEKDRKRSAETLLRARMALASDTRADLETALFDLNSTSRSLSELMMSRVGESGTAGGLETGGAGSRG